MEKHELSKIDFKLIDESFKTLLHSHLDPVTADKVVDLRDKWRSMTPRNPSRRPPLHATGKPYPQIDIRKPHKTTRAEYNYLKNAQTTPVP